MEDSLRLIAADFDGLKPDVEKAASLALVLCLSMSHEYSVLDLERYLYVADTLSDAICDVEKAYKRLVIRLNDITDKLEARKNKMPPVTDQSTQG